MKLIVEDGVNAVKSGTTSLEEIMRVTALKQ
jgi:type II secretory ATPase GspE/PulE/Tfp pilus assembly ATPase PilB-like protein